MVNGVLRGKTAEQAYLIGLVCSLAWQSDREATWSLLEGAARCQSIPGALNHYRRWVDGGTIDSPIAAGPPRKQTP